MGRWRWVYEAVSWELMNRVAHFHDQPSDQMILIIFIFSSIDEDHEGSSPWTLFFHEKRILSDPPSVIIIILLDGRGADDGDDHSWWLVKHDERLLNMHFWVLLPPREREKKMISHDKKHD